MILATLLQYCTATSLRPPIVTIYDVAATSRCDIVATSSKSSTTSWCDNAATSPKSSPRPPIVTISQRRRQNRRQDVTATSRLLGFTMYVAATSRCNIVATPQKSSQRHQIVTIYDIAATSRYNVAATSLCDIAAMLPKSSPQRCHDPRLL